MENFKIESKYLKLCNKFGAVIRCMKVVFYRPDCMKAAFYWSCYQYLLMSPLIKKLGRAFVSKRAAAPLKRLSEFLKHSTKLSKHALRI